jgi:hypothetical protein
MMDSREITEQTENFPFVPYSLFILIGPYIQMKSALGLNIKPAATERAT